MFADSSAGRAHNVVLHPAFFSHTASPAREPCPGLGLSLLCPAACPGRMGAVGAAPTAPLLHGSAAAASSAGMGVYGGFLANFYLKLLPHCYMRAPIALL